MNDLDDRDELLAKLQAIDQKPASAPPTHPLPSPASPSPPPSTSDDDSLDDFLAELDEVDRKTQHLKPKSTPRPQKPKLQKPRAADYPIPNALEQLALFAKEKLEARAQERQRRQQRVQQEDRARAWLEQLDPYSDDGFWFEQFAENYESRLQAAIDFLDSKRLSKNQ